MAKARTYSRHTREVVSLLGDHIKLQRKLNHWTENELAERANISRATLQKIESGELGCSIGLVFEVAVILGVPLFDPEKVSLEYQRELIQDKIALLPKKIKYGPVELFDDF